MRTRLVILGAGLMFGLIVGLVRGNVVGWVGLLLFPSLILSLMTGGGSRYYTDRFKSTDGGIRNADDL